MYDQIGTRSIIGITLSHVEIRQREVEDVPTSKGHSIGTNTRDCRRDSRITKGYQSTRDYKVRY